MQWDPFDYFRRIQDEMQRAFAELPHVHEHMHARPAFANVYETETGVIAEFELPGVDKKDIQLDITAHDVEVKVERKEEKEEKGKKLYRHEVRSMSFYRRVSFPVEIVPEKAKATYRNGILRIEAPKVKQAKTAKRKLVVE
jgi:HSP20 family protein